MRSLGATTARVWGFVGEMGPGGEEGWWDGGQEGHCGFNLIGPPRPTGPAEPTAPVPPRGAYPLDHDLT